MKARVLLSKQAAARGHGQWGGHSRPAGAIMAVCVHVRQAPPQLGGIHKCMEVLGSSAVCSSVAYPTQALRRCPCSHYFSEGGQRLQGRGFAVPLPGVSQESTSTRLAGPIRPLHQAGQLTYPAHRWAATTMQLAGAAAEAAASDSGPWPSRRRRRARTGRRWRPPPLPPRRRRSHRALARTLQREGIVGCVGGCIGSK